MIVHAEGAVTQRTIPGPPLYVVTTMPRRQPRAMIGLLHGYGDHAARYQHVADQWANRGIGTVALDMRGHGRAGGQRGYCRRFDDYLDDAAELWRIVGERAGAAGASSAPRVLLGHSFGALVATASVIEAPRSWRAMVLSAPFVDLALAVPKVKLLLGRVASRVLPRLALPNGLTGAHVTHDGKRARDYDDDPLGFRTANARWFRETQKAQARVLAQAAKVTLPTYVLVGSADPVARVSAGRQLFDRLGSHDKTWLEHDTLFHECFSEFEWPLIAGEVADWIETQI